MNKAFPFILFSLFLFSCQSKDSENHGFKIYAETDSTIHLASDSFQGVIFKPNYTLHTGENDKEFPILAFVHESKIKGWLPSEEAILSFENSFNRYWQLAKTDSLANLYNKTPILWKRINSLERQYVGFIDTTGQKKLWVNIFNVDTTDTVWKSIPYSTSASGLSFYEIKYDVKKDSIYDIYRY